jgi:lipoate-protein ligase A
MAIDEAILNLVGEGQSPPTVRFYEWPSPWVSLGSGQLAGDLDRGRLADRGWPMVRRASGGTAVLHQGHLGYAIILPIDDPVWRGDLIESYRRLSLPFATAFARLGVPSFPAPPGESARFAAGSPIIASRFCFGALGPYELLAHDRKIIGNSQIRRRHSATQHGVIQVRGGQSDLADVIAAESPGEREDLRRYLDSHVDSLEAVAGNEITSLNLANAIVAVLEESLDIEMETGEVSERELSLARELVETKYGNVSWTYRR